MPFKFHSKGRRHIPRQRHRVTNWREYDASLRNRRSLTVWFTREAIAGWKAQPRTTPGGQRHYSDLAIELIFLAGGSTACTRAARPKASSSTWFERQSDPRRTKKESAGTALTNAPAIIRCFCLISLVTWKVAPSVPAKSIAPMAGRACSSRSSPGAVSVALFPMWGASFIPSKSEDEVARRTPCFGACAALELDGDGAERGRFTLTGGGRRLAAPELLAKQKAPGQECSGSLHREGGRDQRGRFTRRQCARPCSRWRPDPRSRRQSAPSPPRYSRAAGARP